MRYRSWIVAATLCLPALASADTRAHEKQQLARFERFAGAPVDEFPMVELFRSQVVGAQDVVLWSTIKQAYLVRVQQPCRQLEWVSGLSVTRAQKWKVSRKFDSVDVGTQCRIVEIRPIDVAAMQQAERAKPGTS
ncbi:MAG: DUF6491 family protein [Rudaea sp.]